MVENETTSSPVLEPVALTPAEAAFSVPHISSIPLRFSLLRYGSLQVFITMNITRLCFRFVGSNF